MEQANSICKIQQYYTVEFLLTGEILRKVEIWDLLSLICFKQNKACQSQIFSENIYSLCLKHVAKIHRAILRDNYGLWDLIKCGNVSNSLCAEITNSFYAQLL